MTPVFSLLSSRAAPARRALAAAALLACTLLLAGAGGAVSARAAVITLGPQLQYGVQGHATILEQFNVLPLNVLQYGGGPVLGANNTYAIYWDPAKLRPGDPGRPGKYHGDWQQLIDQFLGDVGAASGTLGNVFALTPQYPEANGTRAAYSSVFRGAAVDHDSYPSDGCTDPAPALNRNFACLTDQQVREELKAFLAANGLHAGMKTIFYVLTPPEVTICLDAGGAASGHCSDSTRKNPWNEESEAPEKASYSRSFCSYHSATATPSSEPLLYAVIPWVAGTYGALPSPSEQEPTNRDGSDCQDGTGLMQEPNQDGLAPDGTYDHALPDVIINQVAAQQFATVTDPLFSGWTEPLSGDEAPDQCRNWFEGPPVVQGSGTPDEHTGAGHFFNQSIDGHNYYLNTEYNQAAEYYAYPGLHCELHNNLVPSFTAPNAVNAGDVVGFNGAESDITLEQSADAIEGSQPQYRAIFAWNFGDGSPIVTGPAFSGPSSASPLYASVFHAYQYGGQYQVTLTVTDAAGNLAAVNQTITVVGPPPPSPPPGTGGSGENGQSSGGPGGSSQSGSPAAGESLPGPLARAAAVSRSLGQALRHGLAVSYSVNEQVAGQFEVLLDKHTAQHLKIGGPPAAGLPAGSAPALVIGRALVVTTKGGHSVLRIKFSKTTVARLHGIRRLTVTLRLIVRNAASQNPKSTTVISTVVLHR